MADDKREYLQDGGRGRDDRHGFGDDMGTRVGRPDGESDASSARPAPRSGETTSAPGQAGTNTGAVADGLEGSILEDEGDQQRRVRGASEGMAPEPATGDERRIDDL